MQINITVLHKTEQTITLQSLQKLSSDYKFAVSQAQIKDFFQRPSQSNIDFIEFAQFIRHQETTLKRLFKFIDRKHKYTDNISINDIQNDIQQFNEHHEITLHYYWKIDTNWVNAIFQGINERRVCMYHIILALIIYI